MKFTYRILFTGKAQAQLSDETKSVTLTSSWVTNDTLGDLLDAVIALLEGAAETRCSWNQEPGEYRWIFNHTNNEATIRILWFKDSYYQETDIRGSDKNGRLVFATRQTPQEIALAIAEGIASTLDEYGAENYQEWMRDPFPTKSLARLRKLLTHR